MIVKNKNKKRGREGLVSEVMSEDGEEVREPCQEMVYDREPGKCVGRRHGDGETI